MMAPALGISTSACRKWRRRQEKHDTPAGRPRGRPELIPAGARQRLRACYQQHFGQWGPQVLSAWAKRTKLGAWAPATIARVVADLKPAPVPKPKPIRYEITASGVMWSEDGAGFREHGHKRELVVAQDEHSRYKVAHRLVGGPATEDDVVTYLRDAFKRHGAPLVLKHDGGAIFHGERVKALLAEYQVTELTGPRYYPQYNGKKERSVRDIKSYERAMRAQGAGHSLAARLDATIHDLNEERPRPVLGGRTAREVYDEDRALFLDRQAFARDVDTKEEELQRTANSRQDMDAARRRAVECVLLRYRLMEIRRSCKPITDQRA